ncbi:cytochrome C biogenesis protein [Vibrio sp. S9_S30]|uniref:protein-disulfide reductase DsbD family protein n=1 Tax=Vibrio sp. S9_S30 TaxID=2720226 RepID=UPI0016804E81|nr:protein-disulfide reductase DsbD domain-containing protein [Vibrio sp. S9_S30]MBD1556366.1 cytochrome C biogenesis protein [Vibrio sp. S9_S30]
MNIPSIFRYVFAYVTCIVSLSSYGAAHTTSWLQNDRHPPVSVKLSLTGTQDVKTKTVHALLEVRLNDGWKTYWRTPGEGGVAPSIDYSTASNIENIQWYWPTPNYYQQFGLTVLGYQDYVAFPLDIMLNNPQTATEMNATLTLPSCTDICVLADYPIRLRFDPKALSPDSETMLLHNQAMSLIPLDHGNTTVTRVIWDENSRLLNVTLRNETGWERPNLFIETLEPSDNHFQAPTLSIHNQQLTAIVPVSNALGIPDLTNQELRITVKDNLLLQEMIAPYSVGNVEFDTQNTALMLWFAFLGGLILNVMPCVLPVLGIKVNSVLLSGDKPALHRAQFLASAMGIIASFWVLAVALILLKWTGNTVGWGIQFQQPWFLIFLAVVTLGFSLNLFGVFEFKLPSSWSSALASDRGKGLSKPFFQGAFATLLATPCSAPFLGTAVAFALGSHIFDILLIFTFLGMGLAFPWFMFALFPRTIGLLPKPGPWMNKMRVIFALMMSLTSFWLISLLSEHLGQFLTTLVSVITFALLLIALAAKHGIKNVTIYGSSVLLIFGLGMTIAGALSSNGATPIVDDLPWQELDTQAIAQHVRGGKLVFVDITADWCITCKANKIGIILQSPTYELMQASDIVLMRGDWTTPSHTITEFLMSHGRYGVPLNVVYGPNAPLGNDLPVLLTQDAISQSLNLARGK